MCGIVGIFDWSGNRFTGTAEKMIESLSHRGPDDNNVLTIEYLNTTRIGLGHARLSIIDLTASAAQPMEFLNYVITYNGEIYNYQELQRLLVQNGHTFKTNSDTEVILHAFAEWGVAALDRFIGMFAFCIYDRHTNQAYLVRDRVGVKPLYFYQGAETWLFASELKAFHASTHFEAKIDPQQVFNYFQKGVITNNQSIYQGCCQIGAGEIWTLDLSARTISKYKYWNPEIYFQLPKFNFSFDDAVTELEQLLESAYSYRMVADVPVGVFLSGGYDSASVAAILQAKSTAALKTFTIGFEFGNNEAPVAKEIADLLGTEHTEFYCTELEAQRIIPELPFIYDEPFSDSSAIPTVLVSRLARNEVKVALSADGGDELFGGYLSYQKLLKATARLRYHPAAIKPLAKFVAEKFGQIFAKHFVRTAHLARLYAKTMAPSANIWGQRFHAKAGLMPDYFMQQIFHSDYLRFEDRQDDHFVGWKNLSTIEGALLYDYQNYLKDDIMVKVDRSTMSVGLEGREPLLDHRLFQFSAQLPNDYKVGKNTSKRVLKAIVHKHIPQKLMDRPKAGFSVPINQWLRTDLANFLNDFCSESSLTETGIFNAIFLSDQVQLFRENKLYYTTLIWRLLMFQCWYRKWQSPR